MSYKAIWPGLVDMLGYLIGKDEIERACSVGLPCPDEHPDGVHEQQAGRNELNGCGESRREQGPECEYGVASRKGRHDVPASDSPRVIGFEELA